MKRNSFKQLSFCGYMSYILTHISTQCYADQSERSDNKQLCIISESRQLYFESGLLLLKLCHNREFFCTFSIHFLVNHEESFIFQFHFSLKILITVLLTLCRGLTAGCSTPTQTFYQLCSVASLYLIFPSRVEQLAAPPFLPLSQSISDSATKCAVHNINKP